jgi:archaellum biogenesis ATPase FlaH
MSNDNEDHSIEKQLGQVTMQKALYERELISSGIRELDEMMGGGFRPGTSTLLQEDLGSGGFVILEKIIEIQLSLENKVLIIYSDPTAEFFVNRIREMMYEEKDLLILDFVQKSHKNIEILFDKHEMNLEIQEAQYEIERRLAESDDEDTSAFVIYLTLNPFIMNLDEKTVSRMLFERMLKNTKQKTISLMLFQKNIIKEDYHARIAAMFHAIIDLSSEYHGIQKRNFIKILKYVGRYFDPKIEPYSIEFDVERNKFNFLIKSAFLTSFDTYRELLEWQSGTIYLSKVPYLLTPVAYLNMLLDIPLNLNEELGTAELVQKGMRIGRILTINTESLYHLKEIDLLKATMRSAALQGYGYCRVTEYHIDENLLELRQTIHPDFSLKPYIIFLEGFYRGIVKRTLFQQVKTINFKKIEIDEENNLFSSELRYTIVMRLENKGKN